MLFCGNFLFTLNPPQQNFQASWVIGRRGRKGGKKGGEKGGENGGKRKKKRRGKENEGRQEEERKEEKGEERWSEGRNLSEWKGKRKNKEKAKKKGRGNRWRIELVVGLVPRGRLVSSIEAHNLKSNFSMMWIQSRVARWDGE